MWGRDYVSYPRRQPVARRVHVQKSALQLIESLNEM
jgi:hypothetical protein